MTDQTTETDEQRADREETERDHARGDHTHCGLTCEIELPTEHLRNFVIAKGYPGTAGALAELERRAAAKAAPVADLRDRIAAALYDHSHPGWAISFPDLDQEQRDTYLARADAVLAVLPATTRHDTDTSAALTAEEARALADDLGLQLYEAQDAIAFVAECCTIAEREQRAITTADVREWLKGARCGRQLAADAELRRVADETAATKTPEPHRHVSLATPCTVCGHPYNWHTRRHGQCEFVPVGVSRCGCTGFVPGERPEPVDPRLILGADPDFAAATQVAALSPTERTMLDYALNQAQLRMWDTGKYTAEEQAALVSLRRLTAEQPAAGARQDGAQR
ncbi:hypothetical protein [Streptomyces sp. NBC_00334]|uniref:hypothetical protein n=1 Tax=Streptomyces sp. NBC_00334 TaxID=2975713 RepID=UPI002E283A42|nr:hypothetical protein [Streptomyces sp. NBC_00334]